MKKSIIGGGVVVIIAIIVVVLIMMGGSSNNKTPSNNTNSKTQTSDAVLVTKTNSKLGKYLADASGKPLYTYNADTKGVSNCTGSCLANWPAYTASVSTSNLPAGIGTIKRSDNGETQYTYNGMPLYYFTGDTPGNPTGDGVENFSIAKPSASSSTTTNQQTQTQPSSNPTPAPSSSNNSAPTYNYPY